MGEGQRPQGRRVQERSCPSGRSSWERDNDRRVEGLERGAWLFSVLFLRQACRGRAGVFLLGEEVHPSGI